MSTPEERIAALEAWRASAVDPGLQQAKTALTNQATRITALETSVTNAGPRLSALESQYADAVTRYQRAQRLLQRLIVILRQVIASTASQRANWIAKLSPEDRAQAAKDWEAVTGGGRVSEDEPGA